MRTNNLNIKDIKVGIKVVLNGCDDATEYSVISRDGLYVTIQDRDYQPQTIDYSLIYGIV